MRRVKRTHWPAFLWPDMPYKNAYGFGPSARPDLAALRHAVDQIERSTSAKTTTCWRNEIVAGLLDYIDRLEAGTAVDGSHPLTEQHALPVKPPEHR
jgi:hypothetical protein